MKAAVVNIILIAIYFVPQSCSSFGLSSKNHACHSKTALSMASTTSRSEFLHRTFVGTAATLMTTITTTAPANAAKYGSFGAGSPEVLDPKEAIIDKDILASENVQKSLESIKTYKQTVSSIMNAIESNTQVDIGPTIRKGFEFSQLRTDLNTYNSIFDEDTQRGTDRLIRAIIQDITELEIASKQKDGIPRSERRLDIMKGKLEKLSKAFDDLLAFV